MRSRGERRKVSGADQSAFDIFKAFVTLMLPKSLHKLGPDLINMKAVDFFNSIIDQGCNSIDIFSHPIIWLRTCPKSCSEF